MNRHAGTLPLACSRRGRSGTEALVLRYHVWSASISENLVTQFTQNELRGSVIEAGDYENYDFIRLRAVYKVKIIPERR